MPLSAKGRIEVYIPDLAVPAYQNLLIAFEEEFTYNFGGCSVIRGVDGHYLSKFGVKIHDRIALIYTDSPYSFKENFETLSSYVDRVRTTASQTLREETVLAVAYEVYHSI